MRSGIRAGLLLGILVPLAGSASRTAAQDSAAARPRPARASADLITRDQFEGATFRTAWEIVESLKSNWLRQRPGSRVIGPLTRSAPTDSSAASGAGGSRLSPGSQQSSDSPPLGEPAGVQVYLDGMRLGGVERLRDITAIQVYSIRRYSGSEAQWRYGNGHSDGVLLVSTHPEGERR